MIMTGSAVGLIGGGVSEGLTALAEYNNSQNIEQRDARLEQSYNTIRGEEQTLSNLRAALGETCITSLILYGEDQPLEEVKDSVAVDELLRLPDQACGDNPPRLHGNLLVMRNATAKIAEREAAVKAAPEKNKNDKEDIELADSWWWTIGSFTTSAVAAAVAVRVAGERSSLVSYVRRRRKAKKNLDYGHGG